MGDRHSLTVGGPVGRPGTSAGQKDEAASDSRKNLQTLACWAARETRACKFLREGKQSCASDNCLPNPNVATPTQLSDKESSKNAVEGGTQKHVGVASLGQRLGVLGKHGDAGPPAAGQKRGGASSPAAGKRPEPTTGLHLADV